MSYNICTYKVIKCKNIYEKVENGWKITITHHFNYSHYLHQYNFNTAFLIFSYNENNSNMIIDCNFECINITDLDPPDLFCEGSEWADNKLLYGTILAYAALPGWKHTLESRTYINSSYFCTVKTQKTFYTGIHKLFIVPRLQMANKDQLIPKYQP